MYKSGKNGAKTRNSDSDLLSSGLGLKISPRGKPPSTEFFSGPCKARIKLLKSNFIVITLYQKNHISSNSAEQGFMKQHQTLQH